MTGLLIFLLVGMFFSASDGQTDPCVPNCSGVTTGGKVPDPYDCTHFYYCSAGQPSDTSFACQDGVFFDPGTLECDGTECKPICGVCHLLCIDTNDIVADPFNCSIFYECGIAGPEAPQRCPSPKPYYDPVNKVCSDNSTVCCRPSCSPYCEAPGIQVPDPKDCRKYYYCTDSPPYPSFSCAVGNVFNYGTGYCDPNTECKVLCSSKRESPLIP